jgi:hypothetical protein
MSSAFPVQVAVVVCRRHLAHPASVVRRTFIESQSPSITTEDKLIAFNSCTGQLIANVTDALLRIFELVGCCAVGCLVEATAV